MIETLNGEVELELFEESYQEILKIDTFGKDLRESLNTIRTSLLNFLGINMIAGGTLAQDFDDSSDEDEDDKLVPAYNIELQWQKLTSDNPTLPAYYQYALLAHTMGISILYSPQVNEFVRKQKGHHGLNNDFDITEEMLSSCQNILLEG